MERFSFISLIIAGPLFGDFALAVLVSLLPASEILHFHILLSHLLCRSPPSVRTQQEDFEFAPTVGIANAGTLISAQHAELEQKAKIMYSGVAFVLPTGSHPQKRFF